MQQTLRQLGFSEKEANIYLYLVNNQPQTAAELARSLGESRTNIYMVLEKLVQRGVIANDDNEPVRRFAAVDPSSLRNLLKDKQREVILAKQALDTALPDLITSFNLGQQRPGVVYLEGMSGLKASLSDMTKAHTKLLIWGSDLANQDPEVWRAIEAAGLQRKAKGIETHCLFHDTAQQWPHLQDFAAKGFTVRTWGQQPFEGEIVIYDDKVAITTHAPSLIITVLTNRVIADTFRTIFDNCWQAATPLPTK